MWRNRYRFRLQLHACGIGLACPLTPTQWASKTPVVVILAISRGMAIINPPSGSDKN